MDFTYENQGTSTYLVYTIKDDDSIDTMSLGMLTNNKITGLAQTLYMQMNMTKYIKYNVTAKVSLQQFFNGAVNKARLLGVFDSIAEGLLLAEDYMIDTNAFLLDMEHIYVDVSNAQVSLICLPVNYENLENNDLGAFFKNIMVNTQFDSTENSDHVAKIFNFLNSSPVFSLVDFKKLLDDLKTEPKKVEYSNKPNVNVQTNVTPPSVNINVKTVAEEKRPVLTPNMREEIKMPVKAPVQEKPVKEEVKTGKAPAGEKKMTMFSLLRNYSKENKEIYKQQKEAEKLEKEAQKAQSAVEKPKKEKKTSKGKKESGKKVGFAIPGQDNATVYTSPVEEQSKPVMETSSTKPQNETSAQTSIIQNVSAAQNYTVHQGMTQGTAMNFGETTVLNKGNIGQTTVLNQGMQNVQQKIPHLIRSKNNEKIVLDKPVFRIGKEKSYVDYFVADNTAVSRSHANLITRDGAYFVMDTNSTNHTFVNGVMIHSNEEVKIEHGTVIRLANEDFTFKLY